MYMYLYEPLRVCVCVCVCVCECMYKLYNLKVILVECVLIRVRQNLSTSLDKGLWHSEWARTIEERLGNDI